MTQRESSQHSAARDDELKRELANELRAQRPTRAEAWREPEMPEADERSFERR